MRFQILGRSVGRIEKKKNHKKSQNRRLWYPRTTLKVNIHIHLFGLENTQYTPQCVPVFLYAVTMLIFQIKRIISSKNGLTMSLLFFAKNLGWSNDPINGEKKEDGLMIF